MDLVLDSELAEIFSQRTRISKTIIYNTGLKSYESYLSETIRDNSRNNLISTVKIKGSAQQLLISIKKCKKVYIYILMT
jgi:hypothetical protein